MSDRDIVSAQEANSEEKPFKMISESEIQSFQFSKKKRVQSRECLDHLHTQPKRAMQYCKVNLELARSIVISFDDELHSLQTQQYQPTDKGQCR